MLFLAAIFSTTVRFCHFLFYLRSFIILPSSTLLTTKTYVWCNVCYVILRLSVLSPLTWIAFVQTLRKHLNQKHSTRYWWTDAVCCFADIMTISISWAWFLLKTQWKTTPVHFCNCSRTLETLDTELSAACCLVQITDREV